MDPANPPMRMTFCCKPQLKISTMPSPEQDGISRMTNLDAVVGVHGSINLTFHNPGNPLESLHKYRLDFLAVSG